MVVYLEKPIFATFVTGGLGGGGAGEEGEEGEGYEEGGAGGHGGAVFAAKDGRNGDTEEGRWEQPNLAADEDKWGTPSVPLLRGRTCLSRLGSSP